MSNTRVTKRTYQLVLWQCFELRNIFTSIQVHVSGTVSPVGSHRMVPADRSAAPSRLSLQIFTVTHRKTV